MTNKVSFLEFMNKAGRVTWSAKFRVLTNFLKGEFQLLFKLVNKVLFPRSKKRIVFSYIKLITYEVSL